MQPSRRVAAAARSAAHPDTVDCPGPDELVPAVHARLAGAAQQPLAVLDPRWPERLRQQATADLADALAAGHLRPGDLVLFTSGSSGSPRAVVRAAESWRASLQPLTDVTSIGSPDGDPDLVWVPGPLSSTLFLYGAVHAAWCGLAWVRGRPDAPPAQEATAAHLVPTQLADALDAQDQGLLPQLRTVVVAGAHVPPATRARAFHHRLRLVEYYGAAELSFVGWRSDDGPFRSFPGVEVRIGAGERHATGEQPAAPLWVRSPYLGRSYLRSQADGPWRQRDGWHTVGDLAEPVAGGWRVLGRADVAVTTGGHTVVVADVEAVLRRVQGVADVVVLGVPHDRLGQAVVAVVQPVPGHDLGLRPRLERAARELPAATRPRRWLRADRLPLLASGKVDRSALGDLTPTLPRLR